MWINKVIEYKDQLKFHKEVDCDICKELSFIANNTDVPDYEMEIKVLSKNSDCFFDGELSCVNGLLCLYVLVNNDYEYKDDEYDIYNIDGKEFLFSKIV